MDLDILYWILDFIYMYVCIFIIHYYYCCDFFLLIRHYLYYNKKFLCVWRTYLSHTKGKTNKNLNYKKKGLVTVSGLNEGLQVTGFFCCLAECLQHVTKGRNILCKDNFQWTNSMFDPLVSDSPNTGCRILTATSTVWRCNEMSSIPSVSEHLSSSWFAVHSALSSNQVV